MRLSPKHKAYEGTWAQGVLTLVSIVLGVALSVAAQRIFEIYEAPNKDITFDIVLQAYALFFIANGTFYHCYTVTSFYHVVPSIFWVTIPIAVGIGVIMTAYALGNSERFLVATFVFYAAGAACFLFALVEKARSRIGTPLFEIDLEREALSLFRNEMLKNLFCFSAMAACTATIHYFAFVQKLQLPLSVEQYFAIVTTIIYSFMAYWTEYIFLARARAIWSSIDEQVD